MNPEIWGPKLWFFIHTIAINYPDNPTNQDKQKYIMFFESLKHIIPCEKCRLNYIKNLSEMPVHNHLDNANTLFRWTVDLHNKVNSEIGKPILSYEQATQEISGKYLSDNKKYISQKITSIKDKIEGFESSEDGEGRGIPYLKILKYSLLVILLISVIIYALKLKNII